MFGADYVRSFPEKRINEVETWPDSTLDDKGDSRTQ
jgi:hypothetical protein